MVYSSSLEIVRIVRQLIKIYGTQGPEKLCEKLEISILYEDMGTSDTAIKAMMVVNRRIKCIVVNSNLPDVMLRFILAHELGHAVLHAQQHRQFADYGIFDDSSMMEKEANIFAAELMLGDSDAFYHEIRYSELTLFQIAASRNVPYELLAYKLEIMKEEGYNVPDLPYEPDSRFLGGDLGGYSSCADWW